MKFIDLKGQKFERLTALYRLHNYHKKGTHWLCVCDCGNLTEVQGGHLREGRIKSCGCLRNETTIKRSTKHGYKHTRLYSIWQHMKYRCCNKNGKDYKNYGGRGIAVCSDWLDNFMSFYNWSMANGYDNNLTIDRIDNGKGYEPNNCRWVDMKQQSRNTRQNRNITINGVTRCLAEWCEILGLNYDKIYNRLYKGWSIEKALELKGNQYVG